MKKLNIGFTLLLILITTGSFSSGCYKDKGDYIPCKDDSIAQNMRNIEVGFHEFEVKVREYERIDSMCKNSVPKN